MLTPQFTLALAAKLVVDLFAGGGGASTGIEQAIGRPVDIAINHDRHALALHRVNHPQTQHLRSNVWDVDPRVATGGRAVGILWASPDCRHFSPAKGSAPVSDRVRSLAWVVIKWATHCLPDVIFLENIPEFRNWGPVVAGRPCPDRKGKTFRRWVLQLERLGYDVEFRELRACDYGIPTIRKRLFMVAKRRGTGAIVWPEPTHGPGLKPYRTAAECIDWSIPCHSIFLTAEEGKAVGVRRPLAEATLRRIAYGTNRYVIQNPKPFIVPLRHQGEATRVHSVDEPMRTVTSSHRGEFGLVAPTITRIGQTGGNGKYSQSVEEPLTTITTKAEHLLVAPTLIDAAHADVSPNGAKRWSNGARSAEGPLPTVVASGGNSALVAAFLERYQTGSAGVAVDRPMPTVTANGRAKKTKGGAAAPLALVTASLMTNTTGHPGAPADAPVPTLTTGQQQALVASHLVKLRGTSTAAAADEPLGTVSAQGQHHAAVHAFLTAYYGTDQDPDLRGPMHTVPTRDRFTLVTVAGQVYALSDIGMRMLQPRELFRAQGFADTYAIDVGEDEDGRRIQLSKEVQVRLVGNSVCPGLARAIVAANYSDIELRQAA